MIKQIIPQEVCLKCQGCCRFSEKDSVWSPSLLDEEAESLGQKKIRLIASATGGVFFCSLFEPEKNACKIYSRRPFECQLYPFLLKRKDKKTFLAVDPKCPFIGNNLNTPECKGYIAYLVELLKNQQFIEILKNNPQIPQEYPGALEIQGI